MLVAAAQAPWPLNVPTNIRICCLPARPPARPPACLQGQHPVVYWTPLGKNTVRMVQTAPVDVPKGACLDSSRPNKRSFLCAQAVSPAAAGCWCSRHLLRLQLLPAFIRRG